MTTITDTQLRNTYYYVHAVSCLEVCGSQSYFQCHGTLILKPRFEPNDQLGVTVYWRARLEPFSTKHGPRLKPYIRLADKSSDLCEWPICLSHAKVAERRDQPLPSESLFDLLRSRLPIHWRAAVKKHLPKTPVDANRLAKTSASNNPQNAMLSPVPTDPSTLDRTQAQLSQLSFTVADIQITEFENYGDSLDETVMGFVSLTSGDISIRFNWHTFVEGALVGPLAVGGIDTVYYGDENIIQTAGVRLVDDTGPLALQTTRECLFEFVDSIRASWTRGVIDKINELDDDCRPPNVIQEDHLRSIDFTITNLQVCGVRIDRRRKKPIVVDGFVTLASEVNQLPLYLIYTWIASGEKTSDNQLTHYEIRHTNPPYFYGAGITDDGGEPLSNEELKETLHQTLSGMAEVIISSIELILPTDLQQARQFNSKL